MIVDSNISSVTSVSITGDNVEMLEEYNYLRNIIYHERKVNFKVSRIRKMHHQRL